MSRKKNNRVNRRQFLKVAGTSTLTGLVLAACGTPEPSAQAPTGAPASAAPATATSAPVEATAAATAAPVTTTAVAAEPVDLRFVYIGGVQPDNAKVAEAVSQLTKEKIGATVKLEQLDWGAYNDQVTLMNTGGEQFDLVFTARWTNDYYKNVANGTLLPLDDLLQQHAPKLYADIAPEIWDAVRVGGKIYGVPTRQKFSPDWGFSVRKDLAEKYNFDPSTVTSYTDPALAKFMEDVKAGEPDIKYLWVGYGPTEPAIWGYDKVGGNLAAVVKLDDPSAKVLKWFETPEFKQLGTLFQSWAEAGYAPKETLKSEEQDALLKAGQVAMILTSPTAPGGEIGLNQKYGGDWLQQQIAPSVLSTDAVTSGMLGIPTSSEHPEKAAEFLQLINTDQEVFRTLAYGIEGTHYTLEDEAKGVIKIPEDSTYNANIDWVFGNTFLGYYRSPEQVGANEKSLEINKNSTPSPILGFSFDPKPVETELAQLGAATDEPLGVIYNATSEDLDKAIADLNTALQAAGLDTVIAEMQKQIDAWKATKQG